MQMYELTMILPGSFDDKRTKDQLDKFEKTVKDSNGSIAKREDWGKKPLAYPIKKHSEGVFVFYHLELEEVRVNPIARLLENDDNVIRHLMIKGVVSAPSTKVQEEKEEKPKKETKTKEVKAKPKKEVKAKATKTKSKKK